MRKFLASLLTAVMIFSMPTGVQGAAAERAEINRAAVDIASVMQNIMTNYKGDITVQELYEAALSGIAAALDEHSRYISAADLTTFRQTQEGSSLAFGLVFSLDEGGRVVVRDVADGSPAYNAGISPHSVITRVDGVDLTAENYTDIFARLRSPELLRATFDVYLNGETRRIPLTKAHFDDPTVRAVSVSEIVQGAPDHIGYIHIQRFARNTAPQVYAAIEGFLESGVTHVILDLRYNPGGDRDSVNDVARMLVPQGIIYSTIDSRGSSRPVHSRLTATYFEHVAVLTNSRTASAAELLALAVSESGAGTIVGQRTFGKGSIQTIFPLTRGDYFIFTTMEYFGRNGTRINNIGVSPDIAAAIPDYLHGEALPDYDGTSDRIPYVKQLLDFLGYPVGTPDTYHDTTTRASIEQIQSYHGITPSGLVDTTTAFLLDSLLRRELARNDIALRQALDILT